MQYVEVLKALKEKRGLTNAEISKLSKIPLATITRIFNGQTPNPTIDTLAQIAMALGVSLDEIVGLNQADVPHMNSNNVSILASHAQMMNDKDALIKELKEQNEKERKEKHLLAWVLAGVIAFILIILTIDIINSNFGYFIY